MPQVSLAFRPLHHVLCRRVAAALSRAEEELGFLHSQLSRTAQVQLLARRSDAVLAPPSTTYVVEGGSTVPRTAQAGAAPEEPSWSAAGGKGGHFVVRDGEVVEGSGAARGTSAASSFGVSESIDPDALARHKASMRRFKFMDRDGPAPRAPQWS